jgi:hypothetical protein
MRAALALRERLALVQPRAVQELRAHAAHHAASSCSCASCHSDASARLLVTRRRAGSTFPSRSRGAEVLAQDSIDGVEGIDQSIRHAEQGRIELSFVAESRVGRTQRGNGRPAAAAFSTTRPDDSSWCRTPSGDRRAAE